MSLWKAVQSLLHKEPKIVSDPVEIPVFLRRTELSQGHAETPSVRTDNVSQNGTTSPSPSVELTPPSVPEVSVKVQTSTSRSASVIASEYESAIEALEELSTSGDTYYKIWLEENHDRLRAQAMVALRQKTHEAAKELSRLQSEYEAVNTGLSRRLAAVRSLVTS